MYLTYIHSRIVQLHLPHEQHLDCLRVCSDSRRIGGEDGSDEELRNRHPWATSGEGDVGGTYYMYMQLGLHCK